MRIHIPAAVELDAEAAADPEADASAAEALALEAYNRLIRWEIDAQGV